jgi:hypothetical protein
MTSALTGDMGPMLLENTPAAQPREHAPPERNGTRRGATETPATAAGGLPLIWKALIPFVVRQGGFADLYQSVSEPPE